MFEDGTSTRYYDILYVSRLFDMRDSGGFPTFHSVLSFSVSMILANSVSIRDHTVRVSFLLINQSSGFIHSFLSSTFPFTL